MLSQREETEGLNDLRKAEWMEIKEIKEAVRNDPELQKSYKN